MGTIRLLHNMELTIAALGNEPPLIADGRGAPDRREVSARWLSGTFLTGLTSSVLMGVALVAALDGREQVATPPEIARLGIPGDSVDSGDTAKTMRLTVPRPAPRSKDRRRMEVSMVTKVGDRDVIRTAPFVQVKMALAAGHTTSRKYSPFDPLEVFAEDGAAAQIATTGLIYGAKVESEVSLKTIDFPTSTAAFDERDFLSADEVEQVVRETALILTDGDVQVASLHYVDPQRFGESLSAQTIAASYGVRIVPENVSVAPLEADDDFAPAFAEEIIPIRVKTPIADAFGNSGYRGDDALGMADALGKLLNTRALKPGTVLRIGIETRGESGRVVRASIYDGGEHLLTIALNDRQQFVPSDEPETNPEVAVAFDDSPPPVRIRSDLPSVYDGIYRAAYSYGMSDRMTKQLVKLLAAEVDFQSRLNPTDRIDVFFSQPDLDDHASEDSELLYVKTNFGGNGRTFYRFRMDEGTIDYFDQEGRSAKQFLLRNPVPTGRFTSGFGARRHPILGYTRMHTGADWSAPRGTPILATGNGVVEKAGWSGGYGKQTVIRHANGYETSYNHQSAIARGVVPGAEVRQGQVIGYVGSTGLSTGAHLHYELMVNGAKVNPMRVRLPVEKVLKGAELEAFLRERERIDILLQEDQENPVALANLPATLSVLPELLIREP